MGGPCKNTLMVSAATPKLRTHDLFTYWFNLQFTYGGLNTERGNKMKMNIDK